MNNVMVKRLILKDWYFLRWTILGYILGGIVSMWLFTLGHEGAFFAGSVLLLTIMVSVGIHLTFVTVINERKEQTLPFVMSLPISYREYTTAKVLANLLIFLVPWLVLTLGSSAVILITVIPDGLVPFTVLVFVQLFTSYMLTFSVAVITESIGPTVAAMVAGNLFINYFLYAVSHNPTIAVDMKGSSVIWSSPVLVVLAVEAITVLALLTLTFYMQGRKKDFL